MKTIAAIFALLASFFATSVSAQNTYTAYINSDNSAASGCTITLPGGTLVGTDWRIQATLTPGAIPTVTSVALTPCSAGSFGAGTNIGGGSVNLNTGVSGSDSVEFSVPGTGILTGGGQTLAFGFTAQSPTGSDVMFTTNGGPILFGITVPTPALGAGALLLLVLLIMGVAHRFGRTRWYRHMAALSLVAMCGVALAAAFNWTGISPIATDPAGDPTNGSPDIDLRAGFVAVSSGTLYIRIDVTDLQTQAPQITSANATTFIVGQAGTFAVTSIGVPSAALALSGCTLPTGVSFVDNGNGTATLAGTPGPGTANTYACTLTASNGIPPNATQAFTLTVANAPSQTALATNINPSTFGQAVTFTATVTPAPPGSGTPTGNVNFLDGATNIGLATLNGSGVATFTTGTLSVATHPITAQYSGDVNFGPSTSSVVSQVVNQASQTITFTSSAPVGAVVGGTAYTVTATASSGLPVTLTIDASAASVCSLAGSTVSFSGVGSCVIDANQAGDANYTAAPQVQQSFAIGKGSQTITFTSTAPAGASVGGSTYTVTATASSGLSVTLTIDAAATSVCSLAGSTVSFIGVGNCVIDANQAGNANYNAAPQAQQSFAVGKGNQTITFTSTAPANAIVGGPTYTVTATASSGLPVTFTIDATASSVCSISGSTVSFTASGTCVIDANQAGDASYNAAPQVQQSFAVSKNNQTITFTSTAPAGAVVAGPTYAVAATASSGLTVAFMIDASAASVCTISGSTVSFIGVGTCVIDANQAGDANYNAAPQVQQSFAVGKGNQTISFTSTAPVAAAVGGPTYTVAATATSGLPVTLSIDASASSVCSLAGSTVSFIGAGTCVIDANQAGNANYNAAAQAQQSFAVAKGNQTISFTSTTPVSAQYSGASYTVAATASSGLTVTFNIDASAASVCTISGSTVSFIGVGTCVIDADQAGDANWNAAPQAQQSFAVAKADQSITFNSTPASPAYVNDTYAVSATATSGLAVTFSSGAPAICTVAGSTVTLVAGGTCIVNANQSGNGNYNAAPQAQQSFTVSKSDQAIGFLSNAPGNAKVGGPTYTVSAFASSGLPVTFTIDPISAGACTIAGSVVSFVHATGCVIDANQAGNAAYNPAAQVQQIFPIAKGDQTINVTSTAPTYGSATAAATPHTYTVIAAATSGLPIAVSIDATSTAGACSAASPTVTFGASAGTCVIDIDQPGNADWNPASRLQQSSIVEIPASAVADSHTVTGNVAIAAATSVMSNDSGTNIAIRSYGATGTEQTTFGTAMPTAQGGLVTLVAAGTYNYDPPANFTGTDTFAYVIGNDLATTSTGTVTLTVSDRIIVVASGASGNCKPVTPTPCALSFADGLAAPSGKDLVFVQSGNYSNPNAAITLNPNQALVGNGNAANTASLAQAITDAGITLASESVTLATINSATAPSLSNNASVITLGGGNLVEYFSITNSAGAAILGNAAGSGTSTIRGITVADGANAGNGVSITANLGTLDFSNIAIATSSGAAFAASGGSTISATQDNISTINTLASTTGAALNVANTTIEASGLTFRSISSNGAASGIIVNTTGTNGGLTITGNGGTCTSAANCSGGAIQNSTTKGVVLTSTQSPSLTRLNVTDSAGGATDDGIAMTNITGTVKLDTCAIVNSPHNGITVDNFNTNMAGFTMSNTLVQCQSGKTCQPAGSTGNDGILLAMRGTSVLTSGSITGSTFSGMRAVAIQVQANDTGQIGSASGGSISNSFTVQNNTLSDNGIGIDIDSSQVSNVAFQVLNNTVTGHATPLLPGEQPSSVAINAFTAAGVDTGPASHFFVGKIDGNTIGTQGVKDSGSGDGSGIRVVVQGQNTQGVVTVSNNTIREVANADIITLFGQNGNAASGTNTARFKAVSNTMPAPSGSNLALCGIPNTPCASNGIFVLADEGTPVCNIVSGNAIYDVTTMNGNFDIYLAERAGPPAGAQLTVEGTGGNSTYIQANNILAGANKFIDEGGNTTQVALGACGTFP